MARGVNKVILVGNLGKDPEVRYTSSGGAVANITVATSEAWKDKQTGESQERTEWHNVVFFGKLAEIVGEYLRKGSQVYIEGSIRTEKYQKDGQDRYITKIVASEMQMLGSRSGGSASFEPRESRPQTASSEAPPAARPAGPSPVPPPDNGFDDDIPF